MGKTVLLAEIFPPRVGGSGRYVWEIYRRLPIGEHLVLTGEHPDGAAFDATHELPTIRMAMGMRTRGLMNVHDVKRYSSIVRTVRRLIPEQGITRVSQNRQLCFYQCHYC